MTTQQMHDLFELVQDHYNTAYYPEEQIMSFLNAAQKGIFNKLVLYGDSRAESNVLDGIKFVGKYELDDQKQQILSDLMFLDTTIAAVSGVVTLSALETALSRTVAIVTDIADASGNEIKIVRKGEYYNMLNNWFSNDANVLARIGDGGIKIDGATAENFTVSCIVEPLDMDLSTPVQPSLRGVHEAIVIDALNLAGFALNDEALMMIKE